jgi:uncharacterized membrane protein YadS
MTAALPNAAQQPASPSPAPRTPLGSRFGHHATEIAPGLGIAVAVAVVATVIGKNAPVVGSAVPGAVIGAILAIVFRPGTRFAAGLKWASSFVLQCSVVILGTQLSIGAAARAGLASLPVMLGTLAVCLGAALLYGRATEYAVVVKLVRTLMIIPICVGLAWLTDRKKAAAAVPAGGVPAGGRRMSPRRVLRLVPWFLIGFVVAALANTVGLVPAAAHGALSNVSLFFVAVALSAIGLSTDVRALRRAGAKPLLLGLLLWITVAGTSLGLQALTGTLR